MMTCLSKPTSFPPEVTVTCDECGIDFEEFLHVFLAKSDDPDEQVLCLDCDPEAEAPAVTRVVEPAPEAE